MHAIMPFIMANKLLAAIIALGIAICIAIILYIFNANFRKKVNFWWLNFKTTLPVFGTIARLKEADITAVNGWYDAELKLCNSFNVYDDTSIDPQTYEKSKSYLISMCEQGRSTTPKFIWFAIIALVILEALGFAYVLAGYTVPGASESTQQIAALGMSFFISILLVFLTHQSGSEIYKNSKIEEMYIKNKNIGFDTYQNISISNEYDDQNASIAQKIYNRIDSTTFKKRWIVCFSTSILIILIAIGATYVRGQVLEKQLIQEISTTSVNIYETLPSELGQIQNEADAQALKEQQDADRKGGWATFIVLAVLFVFVQILGILFGYKWGFAGKESRIAYNNTHKFNTLKEYMDFHEKSHNYIRTKADEKLKAMRPKILSLRSRLGTEQFSTIKDDRYRTYQNYFDNKISEINASKNKQNDMKLQSAINDLTHKTALNDINQKVTQFNQATQPQTDSAPNTVSNLIQNSKADELTKQLRRLERTKAALLEEGIKKSDSQYQDLEDQIYDIQEQLKGFGNA